MTTDRPPLLKADQAATHPGDCVVQVPNGWGGRPLWAPHRDGRRAWKVCPDMKAVRGCVTFNRRKDADAWLESPDNMDRRMFTPYVLVWAADKDEALGRFNAGELI